MQPTISQLVRRALGIVALFALLLTMAPVEAMARRGGPDDYDRLERYLRENGERFRIALLRTYLPKGGRGDYPLPRIRAVINGIPTPRLPVCPLTPRMTGGDTNAVDYEPVVRLLAEGRGDTIDFVVALARAARIPIADDLSLFPYCAWWGIVDERILNIIFPDAVASYWFQIWLAPENDNVEWRLDTTFVAQRYTSFAIYDRGMNPYEWFVESPGGDPFPVDSTLVDFDTKVRNGKNPFQEKARPREYGDYRIIIKNKPTFADTQRPNVNVMPFFPNDAADFGAEPTYTRAKADGIPIPAPCGFNEGVPPDCPLQGTFAVPEEELVQGVVSNTSNVYIPAITRELTIPLLQRPFIDSEPVIAIRGRVPSTPGTQEPPTDVECRRRDRTADACYCQRNELSCEPVPWNENVGPLEGDFDMRYWSICTAVYLRPYPTIGNIAIENRRRENTGCVPDQDIIQTRKDGTVDPDGGWFAVIISTEANKPRIFRERNGGIRNMNVGANWIQGVEGVRTFINVRNMFPNPDFAEAGTNIDDDSAWTTAFTTMGEYYPVIAGTCSVRTMDTEGWGGCMRPYINDTCGDLRTCDPTARRGMGLPGVATASQ